jgi:hypothetical protein
VSYQLPHWVWPAALMAVCALALWRGRDEERLATAALLANWALGMTVFKSNSQETQWAVLGFDVALLGLYLWLSMRTQRYWPLFVAGFQLLIVVTHVARVADPRVSGWAYLTAQLLFSYLILITIGYASWTAASQPIEASADEPGASGP